MTLKRILIIDDEPDILEVLSFILSSKGYEVLKARDGREALNSLRTLTPDFIFLDLEMPVMNGHELCQHLKRDARLKKVPIVILTACSLSERELEGLRKMQVEGIVRKPFELNEILSSIQQYGGPGFCDSEA